MSSPFLFRDARSTAATLASNIGRLATPRVRALLFSTAARRSRLEVEQAWWKWQLRSGVLP